MDAQRAFLAAFSNLACTDEKRGVLVRGGGVAMVVACMHASLHDRTIQELGCAALNSMAYVIHCTGCVCVVCVRARWGGGRGVGRHTKPTKMTRSLPSCLDCQYVHTGTSKRRTTRFSIRAGSMPSCTLYVLRVSRTTRDFSSGPPQRCTTWGLKVARGVQRAKSSRHGAGQL